MFNQLLNYLYILCIHLMISGCSVIFAPQEWSDNYALMDGVQSTDPQMIDGNLDTIGQAVLTLENTSYRLNDNADFIRNDSIVVVTLPEKKKIYRIILHSENLKHFVVYVDKGKARKGEDWHRVIEMRDVMSRKFDLKPKMPYITDQIKIRILKTHPQVQKQKTFRLDNLMGSGRLNETVITNLSRSRHIPGRIREIEIYGFKTSEQQ